MFPVGASTLLEMARYAPLRTALLSLGPPVWGILQVVNAYLHGGTLPYAVAFALALAAFSVVLTRYHAAVYRRTRLSRRLRRPG